MCGLYGFWGSTPGGLDAVVGGLTRVNHRGHEMFGIAATNGDEIYRFRKRGYVREGCTADPEEPTKFQRFARRMWKRYTFGYIGHTRYSTVGRSDLKLAQPIRMSHERFGEFVLVHNGQIPNYLKLRVRLEVAGHRFRTESDSEVLAQLIACSGAATLPEAVADVIREVEGAFSFIVMNSQVLVAARDRFGVRPLWWQEVPEGVAVASEVGALDRWYPCQEVPAGGMLVAQTVDHVVRRQELSVLQAPEERRCIFEWLYFARPDERFGDSVASEGRRRLGQRLAQHAPVAADLVCGVPESGTDAALGFAESSGIRLEPRALVKNVYTVAARSFILPGAEQRAGAARRKYSVTVELVRGKRIVLVDDTIVRGTTMAKLVDMLRRAGAAAVHLRIAAAPLRYPCFYGIDMQTREELIAACPGELQLCVIEEFVCRQIGADSIRYLSVDLMVEEANQARRGWCTACFTADYPIPVPVPC